MELSPSVAKRKLRLSWTQVLRKLLKRRLFLSPRRHLHHHLRHQRFLSSQIGGVGAYAVEALVRSGLGTIDIIDDDIKVEDNIINTEDEADLGVEIMDYVEGAEEEEIEEEAIPFMLVEQKPSFQGGDANAFSKWVNSRLNYPEIAKENGVQGRVMLQFTVGADGVVRDVKVLRGVDPSLDKEAVRVVSMSPKWTPGKQRDRNVKVTYTFPVIFQLR